MIRRLFIGIICCIGASLAGTETRIVSLAPALTELVCHLGHEKDLVGRSEVCNYPVSIRKLPVAGPFGDPVLERVLALRPTLVIANDLIRPAAAKTLRAAGIKVLLKQCRNLEDYCFWVTLLGQELNCQERAQAELRRIAAFRQSCRTYNRLRQCTVLWVIWDSPLLVAGQGSLPDAVIQMAGAVNAAGKVRQEYFKASYEWVLKTQPDVLIWTVSRQHGPSKKHPFRGKLKAVQQGRVVYELDPDMVQRPGPRLPAGILQLRQALERLP